jgi:DNA invertase Pin-like site-specific DNA recombinase
MSARRTSGRDEASSSMTEPTRPRPHREPLVDGASPRRRRRTRDVTAGGPVRVVAYARVSTREQLTGAGLEAQRDVIAAELGRRGWDGVLWIEDRGFSARDLDRPGIQRALAILARGEADILIASKVDRLSRSVADFSTLARRATREGWRLTVLDVGLDMTSPQGEMMATLLAAFGQFERRLIGERTRDGMAVLKRQGKRMTRPLDIPEDVRLRIAGERAAGRTYRAIADGLNAEGVPTGRGGRRWWPSTVHAALRALEAA